MAKCNLNLEAPEGEAGRLLQKARTAITGIGGSLSGDDVCGDFSLPTPLGTVRGTYEITGNLISLSINEKPLLISCNKIEEKLKHYMSVV